MIKNNIPLIIDEHNDTGLQFVNLQADHLNDNLNLMKKQGYKNICISSAHGWKKGKSIEFLEKLIWVKGLWIIDNEMDFSPINNLHKLEFLSINYTKVSRGKVNFKNLLRLKVLAINYVPLNIENIGELVNLRYLYFSKWPFLDLEILKNNTKLGKLIFDYAKFENLNGIENFKHLSKLKIYSAPKLISINQLKPISSVLKNVYFELCPKIESYKVVDKMHNLEFFYIARSSAIHSVYFINNLVNLRYAYIGVEVADKDIQVLRDKSIEYKKLKTYS